MRGLILFACAAALYAQTSPATQPAKQPGGLEADWDIRPVLQEISAHASRLVPVLEKIDAHQWVAKGASPTYAQQLEASKAQAKALMSGAKALAADPQHLSESLQVLFRIQGLDAMLRSVEEAMRNYGSPAEAQELASLNAENGLNTGRLQQYIVNLAAEREQDLKVMDEEAQRCRGILVPAARPAGKR